MSYVYSAVASEQGLITYGAAARDQQFVLGPLLALVATAMLRANISHAKPGDVVFMHWSLAYEVFTYDELTRLQVATSAVLATYNQTI